MCCKIIANVVCFSKGSDNRLNFVPLRKDYVMKTILAWITVFAVILTSVGCKVYKDKPTDIVETQNSQIVMTTGSETVTEEADSGTGKYLKYRFKTIYFEYNDLILLYHYVCAAKYRRKIFTETLDQVLSEVCVEISERYEVNFVEISSDTDHVHFLIQSVPTYSPTKIVMILKSITAREIFKRYPEVKKQLWGGHLWTSGYFVGTVGKHGNEKMIENYVKNQGKTYKQIFHGNIEDT